MEQEFEIPDLLHRSKQEIAVELLRIQSERVCLQRENKNLRKINSILGQEISTRRDTSPSLVVIQHSPIRDLAEATKTQTGKPIDQHTFLRMVQEECKFTIKTALNQYENRICKIVGEVSLHLQKANPTRDQLKIEMCHALPKPLTAEEQDIPFVCRLATPTLNTCRSKTQNSFMRTLASWSNRL